MPTSKQGQTTAPCLDSSFGLDDDLSQSLLWLFPRTDGPLLELPPKAGEVVIGRDEDAGMVLSGQEVSRRHAALKAEGRCTVLVDLESRNRTFVNGQPIDSVVLAADDVVRIGGWIGVVTPHAGPLGSLAPGLFGGPALRAALAPAERAATSDLPIILEGETGTGKEAVSRAIHGWSGRSGPFVAVNCAALPEALAEGELFGYRRGAFTGAEQASLGFFRSAQRGTLLLDEVCELPLALQAKLLRVLEQREVQPLGEALPVRLDVRVLAAAQEPLLRAVQEGRFRADLYARLDGVTVRLPPLRKRRAEIPYLFARLLLESTGGRPPAVDVRLVERLCLYDFPFNVRELSLLVKRLLVLYGSEAMLKLSHLPERLLTGTAHGDRLPARAPFAPAPAQTALATRFSDAAEATNVPSASPGLPELLSALRASGGNVARASAALGISRQRAYRLMQGRAEVDLESLRAAEPEGDD